MIVSVKILLLTFRERNVHHHSRKVNSNETDVLVSGLNPMEFIDVGVSPTNDMDDDVFVNLDAFDMLGDFPELEVLENSNNGKFTNLYSNYIHM